MKSLSKDAANGKWPSILKDAGLSDRQLSGRQSPCPMCGGKDRFRFDDKDGRGTYYCNACGAGDGYRLYQSLKGFNFAEALAEIAKSYSHVIPVAAKPKRVMKQTLQRMWNGAVPGAKEIAAYLAKRGIRDVPVDILGRLRYAAACPWKDGEMSGAAPAMLARVWCAGAPITIHRTYLTTDVPNRKMVMPHDGDAMKGAYIPLGKPGRLLAIAEGIETILSVGNMGKWSFPCWAAYSADQLTRLAFPDGLEELRIFGDNDASFTGQAAAYALAKRAYLAKINAVVHIPERPGMDWNDVLREIRAAKAQSSAIPARDGIAAPATC